MKQILSGLLFIMILSCSTSMYAQTISSYLLGNNYWYPGADTKTVMAVGGKMDVANFQNIRIGGFGANSYSQENYLEYVKTIKAMGAQPIVQVAAAKTAQQAKDLITYLNITNGQNVRVWAIGNEPDHAGGGYLSDAQIQTYTKTIAEALKSVDPTITVIGAEFAGYSASRYANLIGGAYSITGLVPGKDYYYVDVMGFHRYDMADASELNTNIADLVAKVNAANASRPAGKKLSWGMGEFNSHYNNDKTTDPNKKTYSFNAGQLFAELYGKGMANGAFFMNAWSIYEGKAKDPVTGLNTIDRTGTDLSLFDVYTTGYKERSSYWHSLMIGQNMRANYATSTDNQTTVGIVAMKDANGASVMIVNKNTANGYNFSLNLNNATPTANALTISVDAGINKDYTGNIGATTTQMLIFDSNGFLKKRYTYTKVNADAKTGPYVENFTNTNVAPTSTLTAPANNTAVDVNTAVTFSANATDSDGTIAKVEFFAGTTLIGTDTSNPYSISWTPTTAGTYAITAKATDNDGASTTSVASSLIVNAIVVYAPIPGTIQAEDYSTMFGIQTETTTDAGGGQNIGYTDVNDWLDYTVNVQTAGAYTVGFRVASLVATGKIELRNQAGTALATLTQGTTGGWQTWVTSNVTANLAAGNQTLRLYYTGAGLNLNWVQFTKVNTPPSVTLTAPANNTSVYVNTAVTVSANAADSDGTISKVDFFAGATLIGTDTSSPYSISWTPATVGTFAITAKATDNGGSSTTSTAANLIVAAATTTVTLNPTADAYVRGGTYAATNFGTTADLYVKTAPEADGLYTRRAYLKFSVAGMSGVQNAVVRLYAGTAAAFSVKVNETTDAWTETAVNWNNAPAAGTLIATKAITTAGVYYEWNVTSFVQSQAAGDGIVSLVFSDAATTNLQIIFNSKEATANKPQLVVTSSGLKSANVNSEIQEIAHKDLTIYPNPVSNELHILNIDQNSTIEIYNLSGKLILVKELGTENNTFNVSGLKSGMYILKATGNGRASLTKFIKK